MKKNNYVIMKLKYINEFDSHRSKRKNGVNAIDENVILIDGVYKVMLSVDIPESDVNKYIKKTKDNTGKDLLQLFSKQQIAELMLKTQTDNLNVDNIAATALVGGQVQNSTQNMQVQSQGELQPTQGQSQEQSVQNQSQSQPHSQPSTQKQSGDFEDVNPEEDNDLTDGQDGQDENRLPS